MSENKSRRTRQIQLPFASVDEKTYIFASYGHDDKEAVFPLLKKLYESGYNVWYDEGITIGERYDEVIENHIRQSAVFLLFTSSLSVSRPYVTDVELKIAYENRENAPIIPLYIEKDVAIPEKVAQLLPETHWDTIEQVLETLQELGTENFGERDAVPIEREVPLFWFDGHDLDPKGGTKSTVFSKETPYACLAFHSDDLVYCNPYIKELYFAGYNVRSCENSSLLERTEMITGPDCRAYVPFVTKKYIESGQLEQDYAAAKSAGKPLIALYIPTYDENGQEEKAVLPPDISEEFSLIQGIDLRELTNNDFLSKIELELETKECYASRTDGKVERRSFEIKEFLYDFTEDGKGLILTQFRGDNTAVNIRQSYSGFPVYVIGDKAFYDCINLTSVTIPNGVIRIGYGAFCRCSNLNSVMIPDSVTKLGEYSFSRCSSLTALTIPNSVTTIGDSAFSYCAALSEITIPNRVRTIRFRSFYDCDHLSTVTIPNSVTRISDYAFSRCSTLNAVAIPDSVISIGRRAFSDCGTLTTITIPDSVTTIGYSTFDLCDNLTILCSENSYAWQYCEENNIPHILPEEYVPAAAPETAPEITAKPTIESVTESTAPAKTKTKPLRWLIPLILALVLLAGGAAVQLLGIFDILGWLGGLLG